MTERDATFERLKGQTLDMLGSVGGTWMSLSDIALEHFECDGEVDQDMLVEALEELVDDGEIEHIDHSGEDEYRWVEKATGDDWTESDRGKAVRAVDVLTGKESESDDIHAQLAAVRKELVEVRESLGEAVTLLGRLVAMAEGGNG